MSITRFSKKPNKEDYFYILKEIMLNDQANSWYVFMWAYVCMYALIYGFIGFVTSFLAWYKGRGTEWGIRDLCLDLAALLPEVRDLE